MNPVTVAIERAVKVARDAASLSAAFEKEVKAIEFSPDAESSIFAVPLNPALAWGKGELTDLQLLMSINGQCDVIWWFGLPRINEFYKGLEMAREFYQRGAKAFITYTATPVMKRHLERRGGIVTHSCDEGSRYYFDSVALGKWMKHLCIEP